MEDEEPPETPAALQMTREEARATLERQLDTLDDIDTKAAKILRLNVVVAGALLTVVSITVDADLRLSPLYNAYSVVGAVALILSTVFAALTYTVSDVQIGVDAEDVRDLLEHDDEREVAVAIVEGYADWIAFNYRENVRNAPLITATMLLLIYALAGFFLAALRVAIGAVPFWVQVIVAVSGVSVTYMTGIHAQLAQLVSS